jgi:hypothetical protein
LLRMCAPRVCTDAQMAEGYLRRSLAQIDSVLLAWSSSVDAPGIGSEPAGAGGANVSLPTAATGAPEPAGSAATALLNAAVEGARGIASAPAWYATLCQAMHCIAHA